MLVLPAGAAVGGSVGWKAISHPVVGFSYEDPVGANGPIKAAVLGKARNGTFLLKVTAEGALGPGPQPHITVVPGVPGTDGGMRFTITGGASYCVAFGAGAGGKTTNGPRGTFAKVFKIAATRAVPTVEAGCPSAPTTTSTSSSTSTSTSTTLVSGCFQDWGDGTIRDTCTGLQWEKKTTAVGSGVNPADLHDVDNHYSWAGRCSVSQEYCQPNATAAAACAARTAGARGCAECAPGAGTCNVDPFTLGALTTMWDWVSQLNAASFAGQSDWRLPRSGGCCPVPSSGEPAEVESIFGGSGGATIDPIFGPTAAFPDYIYWSATSLSPSDPRAFMAHFGVAAVGYADKGTGRRVRAVR